MAEKVEIKFYKIDNITQATTKNSLFAVKSDNENSFKLYVTDLDGNLIPLFTSSGTGGGITNLTSTDSSILITGSAVKDLKISTTLKNLINSALQSGSNISELINDSNFITLADIPTFTPSDYDLEDFNNVSADPFVRQSEVGTGSGANLAYTASPTQGTVTSDSGTNAIIPLADNVNAGLINSAEKSKIATAIQPTDLGAVATSNDYTDLDNIPTTFTPSSHTHVEADITDLDKYTQSEVDNFLNDKFDNPTGNNTQYLDGAGTPTTFPNIPSVSGLVPYTGATQDVDLGEYKIKAGQVEFDQTPTGTFGVGMVRWNDTDGTTERRLKGNNVTLQDGQEVLKRVVNKTGSDLLESQYKVVRIRTVSEGGAQGQRSAVVLAQANSNISSKGIIGVVTETITNNQEGFITLIGEVRGINTTGSLQGETWVEGDLLYLSPTTAGQLTNIVPTSPNYSIPIATIDYAHAVNGKISVHVGERLALDTTLSGNNDTAPSETAVKTYVDSKISNTITNGVTDKAPNEDTVFDALATKQDNLTDVNFGAFANALIAKTTVVDSDLINIVDSTDSNKSKKTSWLNVWTNYIKPKVDSLLASFKTANFLDFTSSGQTQLNGKFDKSNIVVKSLNSDVTMASTTQLITNLSFSIEANENWVVEFNLSGGCSSGGGTRFQINTPSGATGNGHVVCANTQASIGLNSPSLAQAPGSTQQPITIYLTIRNGINSGVISLSFASNSAGQTSQIRASSYMIATKTTIV